MVHPACAWEGRQVWMSQQDTAPVLLKRRAGRNASCQICLLPNLPHAKSAPCLQCLCSGNVGLSELSGQDAAFPATTGDPPPLLRPKPQAGWAPQVQRKLPVWVSVWQGNESEHTLPSHPEITQTLQAPALELRCNTIRCKTGDRVTSSS